MKRAWVTIGAIACLLTAACGGAPVSPSGAPVGSSSAASSATSSSAPASSSTSSAAATKASSATTTSASSSASSSAASTATASGGAAPAGVAASPSEVCLKAGNPTPAQETQGVTDTEVVVGEWNPQTGPAAPAYSDVARTADAYFKYLNEQGGVNGRKIRLIITDDQYQPALTLAAVKKMNEQDKIFALNNSLGTPPGLAAMPYVCENHIPNVAIQTGSSAWSKPPNRYYFGMIPNYTIEGHIMSKYAMETLKAKKVGIFYQNDAFGKEAAGVFEDDLKKANVPVAVKVTYEPTDTEFSSLALKLQAADPDVVFLNAIPKPAALLLKEAEKIGFKPKWIGSYVLNDPAMFDLAGKSAMEGVILGQYLVDPEGNEPGPTLYREQLKKYYPNAKPSAFAQGGWVGAQILAEGLKRAGKDLTRSKLIDALDTLKDWQGGLNPPLSYSPTDRSGFKAEFFVQAKDGKYVRISDFVTAPST